MKMLVFLIVLVGLIVARQETAPKEEGAFKYQTEQFADVRIIRYQVPGFEELDLKTKKLLYFLSQAALSGRDIIYDQNFKYNLLVRRTLEAIIENYSGDKNSDDFKNFMVYAKRVWFANGIHHHYSKDKFKPAFSADYFSELVKAVPAEKLPLAKDENIDGFLTRITPIMFDESLYAKSVNLDAGIDHIKESANNYYEGVTEQEVVDFYKSKINKNDAEPISWGLNSKLIKEDGVIKEKVWKIGGMYSAAIEQIVYWLNKAVDVAENDQQKKTLQLLIKYYQTGDLHVFDEYSIAWVNDTESKVDMINGFIEVYGDALGYRGAYESIIQVKDPIATKRIAAISKEAQWFEDNSPLMAEHKKENVKGITANVINAVMEAGDAAPSTPIGVNLPNANWIRSTHGSKSVNLGNIVDAYSESSKSSGSLE